MVMYSDMLFSAVPLVATGGKSMTSRSLLTMAPVRENVLCNRSRDGLGMQDVWRCKLIDSDGMRLWPTLVFGPRAEMTAMAFAGTPCDLAVARA